MESEKLLIDPHSPAYEAARGEMVKVLRQIGREDSQNGYTQMADDLAVGNLMEVPTWIALALMATRAPADLRSALEAEQEDRGAQSAVDARARLHKLLREGWYKSGHSYPMLSVDADAWIKEVQKLGLQVLAASEAASMTGKQVMALIQWARNQMALPDGSSCMGGHIDENHRYKLRDLVSAIDAASLSPKTAPAIPDGWKLVPIKPTDEQVQAGIDGNPTRWDENTDIDFSSDVAHDVYYSMVSAAPDAGDVS